MSSLMIYPEFHLKWEIDFGMDFLPDTKPIQIPSYWIQPAMLKEIKSHLKGFIQPNISPWGAPILFVRKKYRYLRMYIDNQHLNKVTIKNMYHLPSIDDLFDQLLVDSYFSKIQFEIEISPTQRERLRHTQPVVQTRYGHYKIMVMSYGLTNAPVDFMDLMNRVLRNYLDSFIIIFIEDILVYSNSEDKHMNHLRISPQGTSTFR